MQTNDLKDPKLEQIIKELQAMRKEFEELETKLANRELENKNDWLQKLQTKNRLNTMDRKHMLCVFRYIVIVFLFIDWSLIWLFLKM